MGKANEVKTFSSFTYFEHTADIEFEAYGVTLEECFENAAIALENCIINVNNVEERKTVEREVKGIDMLELLYNLLEEALLLFEIDKFVFSKVKVNIDKEKFMLKAKFFGEDFSFEKHETKYEVKAITWHNLKIGEKVIDGKKVYYCHVIVDI